MALHRASSTNHKPIVLPPGNINVSETCLFKQLAMCIDTWMLMNDMISQEKMASCARGQSVLLQPVGFIQHVSLKFHHPSTERCFPTIWSCGSMGYETAHQVCRLGNHVGMYKNWAKTLWFTVGIPGFETTPTRSSMI